jgi:hypothetical protein
MSEVKGHVEQTIEKGGKDQAIWLLKGFIRFCPAPYYRRIAKKMLDDV